MEKQQEQIQAITAQEVIKNRQKELFNEIGQIDEMMKELKAQMEALQYKRQLRMMEYEMMDRFEERGMVRITSTTTVEHHTGAVGFGGRHNPADKVSFEDTLKLIFEGAGRPLQVCQIITELEKFGFTWSKYVSAHGYITRCGLLEKVSRGFYQLLR